MRMQTLPKRNTLSNPVEQPSKTANCIAGIGIMVLFWFTAIAPAIAGSSNIPVAPKRGFTLQKIGPDLQHPWSIAWVSRHHALVTERGGKLLLINLENNETTSIANVPKVFSSGQGGLLEVVTNLTPKEIRNRVSPTPTKIWLCYSKSQDGGSVTAIASAMLHRNQLRSVREIYAATPVINSSLHFGCRLGFGPDGMLYATLGERGNRHLAQDPSTSPGSVLRLRPDGSIPPDNPFVGKSNSRPEIFTYGHRNPQGLAVNPSTGRIWVHEHGPRGGDEINILSPGDNYGWPVLSYGKEYVGGQVGIGFEAPGYASPLLHWTPSIAPSGMAFYHGEQFPQWSGDLLVGSLKFSQLIRVELTSGSTPTVINQEAIIDGDVGRIRDVRVGPQGNIWILTDEYDGGIWKLSPR